MMTELDQDDDGIIARRLEPGTSASMSFEEYLKLDTESRVEWVRGEAFAMLPSLLRHARMVSWLGWLFGGVLDLHERGDVFICRLIMHLETVNVARRPDIVVALTVRRGCYVDYGLKGPGDIVVELISDDSLSRDRVEKLAEYQTARVPEYITYDTREDRGQLDFFRLDANDQYRLIEPDDRGRIHSAVLPGFWLEAAWFETDPLPSVFRLLTAMAPEVTRRRIFAE